MKHPVIEKYNRMRDSEIEKEIIEHQKLRRRIEDYMRKYCDIKKLKDIAEMLGIK